ncbi:MAG TPA: MFS transporter [Streptosporangiaceae bacterium]|nr:MFS transporter [Streptosporangiaceae bacterium]
MSRGGFFRRFPVLGIRDFRLLLTDRLIAPASVGFSIVGVSFAVLKATGSAADLSYVLAAQIAPSLVFALLGGVAADRFPPQRVIVAANLLMALGEGTFGLLALTSSPPLWAMIGLEAITGTGVAIFYPASQALLPRLVPRDLLQEASAISRLVMNVGQMAGAALAGLLVAAAGAGWALVLCGIGMISTIPMLLAIRGSRPVTGQEATAAGPDAAGRSMLTELREGWSEFRSHTWLWVIVAQFCVVMMAWYGAFSVLGPVVAREHLGGPAAWGAITAADAFGLIAGGLAALRFTPRRPMLFVVLTGGAVAISPLSLAMVLPLPAVCLASFGLGVFVEMMMVQWTVTMARNIPPDKLARVSSYDVLGSVMAMPAGALIAGPLGTAIGAARAQYAAAAVIVIASALALIPRDVRTFRSDDAARAPAPEETTAALEAA